MPVNLAIRTRISRAFSGLLSVLFSRNIFRVNRTCILLSVIFQGHILKKDPWRWLMHFSIFAGILLLTLFHAMDDLISANLFSDYAPAVNPYLFLRNLFAAMVLLGIVIAVYRRLSTTGLKKVTKPHDVVALVLLSIILLTGFFLEAGQIVSEPIFNEMVEDYGDPEDTETLAALQSYWAKNYGVVFAVAPELSDPELISAGEEAHMDSCVDCHSRPTAAFISNPISKLIKPAGRPGELDSARSYPLAGSFFMLFRAACLFAFQQVYASFYQFGQLNGSQPGRQRRIAAGESSHAARCFFRCVYELRSMQFALLG